MRIKKTALIASIMALILAVAMLSGCNRRSESDPEPLPYAPVEETAPIETQVDESTQAQAPTTITTPEPTPMPTPEPTPVPTPEPMPEITPKVFVAVAAGGSRNPVSYAISDDGRLWGWGSNGPLGRSAITGNPHAAQLGIGEPGETINYPTVIMENVVAVSTSGSHTLALKNDGNLWAWGDNTQGQLGDGTEENRSRPVWVMDDVVYISANDTISMAIRSDGTLWAWGLILHTPPFDARFRSPRQIMDNVLQVATGGFGGVSVVRNDGNMWGFNMITWEQSIVNSSRNEPIMTMEDVVYASAGGLSFTTLALRSDGSLWSWGRRRDTARGDGGTGDRNPVWVLDDVAYISAGNSSFMAIRNDGSLWGWGGLIPNEERTDWAYQSLPVWLMYDVEEVATGISHVLVIRSNGSLWTWGQGAAVSFGDGTEHISPTKITEIRTPEERSAFEEWQARENERLRLIQEAEDDMRRAEDEAQDAERQQREQASEAEIQRRVAESMDMAQRHIVGTWDRGGLQAGVGGTSPTNVGEWIRFTDDGTIEFPELGLVVTGSYFFEGNQLVLRGPVILGVFMEQRISVIMDSPDEMMLRWDDPPGNIRYTFTTYTRR